MGRFLNALVLSLPIFVVASVGCQLAPTKVSESFRPEYGEMVSKTSQPIVFTEKTVVLDTRSAFDFGLSRIQDSRLFSWENLAESRDQGYLLTDLRKVSQRLALNGLDIHTPVIVVAGNPASPGAGRLAWSLLYYGFYDVQVANIDLFKNRMTNRAADPVKNVDPKEVQPRAHLEVLKPEFEQLLKNADDRKEKRIFIIDVRSEKEFAAAKRSDLLWLEWKEFYHSKGPNEGRPNSKVIRRLAELGVQPSDRIVPVSNKGERSGAAAFSLIALGFAKVQNFTGGWSSLNKGSR